jgi:hypothetical protein
MDDRKKIEDRLRKKEVEIDGLEERLRAARIYAQALQDVLKLLGSTEPSSEGDSSQPKSSKLRAGSAVDQARQIILARREPVHITALLEAMGKDSGAESRVSLAGSLAAYVRRGEIFSRPAPNTFGLLELGHSDGDETDEVQPPTGFGKVTEIPSPSKPTSDPIEDDIPF